MVDGEIKLTAKNVRLLQLSVQHLPVKPHENPLQRQTRPRPNRVQLPFLSFQGETKVVAENSQIEATLKIFRAAEIAY